jgi:multimeric flavodoxin WrbA
MFLSDKPQQQDYNEIGVNLKNMKKVIAINSSRRKKNTYNILQQIKARLTEDIQVDIINLSDYQIKECVGCENCIRKGTCHINDDAEALMRKLTEYDGIIIGTPIYMNNISGTLKVFVDRTCRWLHRPELVAKPIL